MLGILGLVENLKQIIELLGKFLIIFSRFRHLSFHSSL